VLQGDVGAVHHDCLRRWLVESADKNPGSPPTPLHPTPQRGLRHKFATFIQKFSVVTLLVNLFLTCKNLVTRRLLLFLLFYLGNSIFSVPPMGGA